ncbi:MAG: 3'-5' exonuclease domain-containing protein 2 [Prevotellaceae bacterium]|nr:3'-5' exonuclease domain-containing protein 2 [Prevotellaceae bacterium]
MKRTIYNKFDKQLIAKLPVVKYSGRIITILSEGEAERAVDYLLSQPIIGIDSETRPAFRKGHTYKVSLLQVATQDICFLFRLNFIGLPPCLIRLLENKQVPMVGLSLQNDLRALHERAPFKPGRFIDLQQMVGKVGIQDMSLQKLYANLFHQRICKRQRLSNWEADVLTEKQKEYAAIDAWSCILIYDEILSLTATGDYDYVVVTPELKEKASAEESVN